MPSVIIYQRIEVHVCLGCLPVFQRYKILLVILSVAKNLWDESGILRYAQNDISVLLFEFFFKTE